MIVVFLVQPFRGQVASYFESSEVDRMHRYNDLGPWYMQDGLLDQLSGDALTFKRFAEQMFNGHAGCVHIMVKSSLMHFETHPGQLHSPFVRAIRDHCFGLP